MILILLPASLREAAHRSEEGEGPSHSPGNKYEYAAETQPSPSFQAQPSAAWELPGLSEMERPAVEEAAGWGDDVADRHPRAGPEEFPRRNAAPVDVSGGNFSGDLAHHMLHAQYMTADERADYLCLTLERATQSIDCNDLMPLILMRSAAIPLRMSTMPSLIAQLIEPESNIVIFFRVIPRLSEIS